MMKYWKADGEMSRKIKDLIAEWDKIVSDGDAMAKEYGADGVYTASGFTRRYVAGFVFKDESKVDQKLFCRLKNSVDGWKPRANRKSDLFKRFESLQTNCLAEVMDLIEMKLFGKGMEYHTPGVIIKKNVAYLVTPDHVNAKGCERISDLEYEQATAPKRHKKTEAAR